MRLLSYRTDRNTLRPGVALDDQVVDLQTAIQEFAKAEGSGPQEWLKPGDEVIVSIEGIGSLSNTCALEPASR